MQFLQAIILGLVQGLTEFIPVSSSGHLLFLERLFGWDTGDLAFDVALHLGTLIALLCFFRKDWVVIIHSFWLRAVRRIPYEKQPAEARSGRLFVPIMVATIPAAVIGGLFNDRIEAMRTEAWMLPAVAGTLTVVAVVMLVAERLGRQNRGIDSMNYADHISIGCAQALALFAGVSRSGITISTGLFRGIDRAAAARFSFLLSTPIILAAGLKSILDLRKTGIPEGEGIIFAVGFIAAAVSGYLAIRFLMSYLQRGSLKVFAIYRFALAAAILGVAYLR